MIKGFRRIARMMIRQIVDHHCQNFACGMVIGICGGEYLGMLRIKKVVCQANLRGAVRLLAARREIDFTLLHCVRVSIEDFPRATPAARRACAAGRVLLPRFVREADAYRRELDEIAAANGIA